MSTGTREIAIYGAGGFGREIACLIRKINEANPLEEQWKLIGFFDDGVPVGTRNVYGEVLGGIDILNAFPRQLGVVVAIGDGGIVKKIVEKITNPTVYFPNLTHGSSFADPDNYKVGKGNILISSHLSCAVCMGDFNVANGGVVFGHDTQIGSYNTFMPAVRISGEVKIGNGNFFGVGSIVLQGMKIGNEVRLAAGSVMMTKPKDGGLYMGVPATRMRF